MKYIDADSNVNIPHCIGVTVIISYKIIKLTIDATIIASISKALQTNNRCLFVQLVTKSTKFFKNDCLAIKTLHSFQTNPTNKTSSKKRAQKFCS